jgi:hypothetical protein
LSADRKISGSVTAWTAAAVIFLIVALIVAGPSWGMALYRFSADGCMLLAWLIACAGYGWIVHKWAGRDKQWALVTSIAAGMGILSLLVLGLGLRGWLNRDWAIALLCIGIAIAAIPGYQLTRKPREDSPANWPLIAMAPLAALVFIAALFPPGLLWGSSDPNGYDVVEYHLQVPREWFEAGKIVPLHYNVFSYFPFNVEMHYLLAMRLQSGPWHGMYLAQLMHATMCALTVAAVWTICGGGWRGTAAAILTASAPWIPMLAAVAYNEGGMLLWGTLAIGWSMRAQNLRQIALAGIFAGFAAGAKLTAVPVLFLGIPAALLVTQPSLRTVGRCALLIVCAIAALSPWLIRNQAWTGNPVFPEAMHWLGRGHFSEIQAQRWHLAHELPSPEHRSIVGRFAAFGAQVLVDWRYGFVLLPLALAAIVISPRRQTTFLAILLSVQILFWICFTHLQGRFMVMAIPIAAILVAHANARGWKITVGLAAAGLLGMATTVIALRLQIYLHVDRDVGSIIGHEDLNWMKTTDTTRLPRDLPVDLVGDARAFLYQIPMSRLNYKTVFDVDTSDPSETIVQDWLVGMPPTPTVLIDDGELARFAGTYYKIPSLSPDAGPSR